MLAEIPSGAEREIELDGRTYMVGRTDIGNRRLYVLLDIEPVERFERLLVILAAVTTTAAALLAIVLGSRLGRRALDPVSRLQERVAREGTFAGETIHELRTRLARLRSSSEYLSAQTDLSPAVREHVETVQHAAGRLQLAVDSLAATALVAAPDTAAAGSTGPVAGEAHPSAET